MRMHLHVILSRGVNTVVWGGLIRVSRMHLRVRPTRRVISIVGRMRLIRILRMHLQVRLIRCTVYINLWRRLIRVPRMHLRARLTRSVINVGRI